ncbi:MAG: iron-containing redox enzyme family protein [Deltaproteobacteria bacterium]|nr:iron-containing redox enzyme family protein [Deltaproteobacteria bacterium]
MSTIRRCDTADLTNRIRTTPVVAHEASLVELRALRDNHPLWSNRLFQACESGSLDRSDLRYIFSQYQLYSRSFTRFISAVMANCDSDLFRARLSENLWEEGGGCAPERRHAELFRRFLRDALDVPAPEDTEFEAYTQLFVREYLTFCLASEPLAGSAFLSLGTEGIVPRMYEIFMRGLGHAGLRGDELEFFKIHVECDDDHALTLEQMMLSYTDEPRWFEICKRAMTHALDLRLQFFERCVDELQRRRLDGMLARVNSGVSLCPLAAPASEVRHRGDAVGPALYTNRVEAAGIDFEVSRIPLQAEVLDPRRVAIPPGRCNERHRHAHETFIYILAGIGQVDVDAQTVDVVAGDSVMVPRWALHQTRNTGTTPLQFLAVTDYQLTKRAFVGDAQAYRLDESANLHRRE